MIAKRARRRVTSTAVIRSWRSQGGRYSVEEINSMIDGHKYYLAVETLRGGGQVVLSRHRKRTACARAVLALLK